MTQIWCRTQSWWFDCEHNKKYQVILTMQFKGLERRKQIGPRYYLNQYWLQITCNDRIAISLKVRQKCCKKWLNIDIYIYLLGDNELRKLQKIFTSNEYSTGVSWTSFIDFSFVDVSDFAKISIDSCEHGYIWKTKSTNKNLIVVTRFTFDCDLIRIIFHRCHQNWSYFI